MSPSKKSSSRTSASSSSDAGRGRDGRPLGSSSFEVDWGGGSSGLSRAFSEVVFPRFLVEHDGGGSSAANGASDSAEHLVLRRGATGALDLYEWWDRARRGQAPRRRVVTVRLMAADGRTVLMTWRFREARPVALHYSPLLAMETGVLMETIEIAFHSVEIS